MESIADQSKRYKDTSEDKSGLPGAYKKGTDILALMRDNIEWRLAEIYDIREAKFFKEEVNESDIDDKDLYDEIPVQDHPVVQTNEQNRMTYVRKYIQEFKD